jgi:AhpD family alkylhydroperoxidase
MRLLLDRCDAHQRTLSPRALADVTSTRATSSHLRPCQELGGPRHEHHDFGRTDAALGDCAQAVRGDVQAVELDHDLRELIDLRASQIKGCTFCLDMHWKDARAGQFREPAHATAGRERATRPKARLEMLR